MIITMSMLWSMFAIWSIAELCWNLIKHRDVRKTFDKVWTWGLYSIALTAIAYFHLPAV